MFYRRIKSRIGAKGAITATAINSLTLVYRMLKYGKEYLKQSIEQYEQKIPKTARTQPETESRRVGVRIGPQIAPNRSSHIAHTSTARQRSSDVTTRQNSPH